MSKNVSAEENGKGNVGDGQHAVSLAERTMEALRTTVSRLNGKEETDTFLGYSVTFNDDTEIRAILKEWKRVGVSLGLPGPLIREVGSNMKGCICKFCEEQRGVRWEHAIASGCQDLVSRIVPELYPSETAVGLSRRPVSGDALSLS